VIEDRLNKGQFDRTDLTLKDLDTIRRTLAASLKGMYHPRLRYPETPSVPEPAVTTQLSKGASPPSS
jgi:membrane-associated HD superfamily phosphohydrolase